LDMSELDMSELDMSLEEELQLIVSDDDKWWLEICWEELVLEYLIWHLTQCLWCLVKLITVLLVYLWTVASSFADNMKYTGIEVPIL
jgi:hypothetical protein